MSDTPQGPGWWQASDGKYYPPEQAPGGQTPASNPGGGVDIGAALSYGWNKFIQNIGDWIVLWLVFIAIGVLFVVLSIILGVGSSYASLRFNVLGIGLGLVQGIVQGVILVVLARAAVDVANGQKVEIGHAFQLTSNNIIAGVIFGLGLGISNSVCFLIGIALYLLLGFYPIISAERDMGVDGLNESVNFSTSKLGEVFLILLVAWALTAFTCGLGAPIAVLAMVYAYRQYSGATVAP